MRRYSIRTNKEKIIGRKNTPVRLPEATNPPINVAKKAPIIIMDSNIPA
jgi:hypothetical protein